MHPHPACFTYVPYEMFRVIVVELTDGFDAGNYFSCLLLEVDSVVVLSCWFHLSPSLL